MDLRSVCINQNDNSKLLIKITPNINILIKKLLLLSYNNK